MRMSLLTSSLSNLFRELAKEKLKVLEKKMKEAYSSDSDELLEISKECFQYKKEVRQNEMCILDLQINYFEKCCLYATSSCGLMIEDQQKYAEEFERSSGTYFSSPKSMRFFSAFWLRFWL